MADGKQTRDFRFVRDVVAATRRAAEAPDAAGSIYNVGGGSQIALIEAIDLIGELAGRRLEVQHLGPEHGDVRDTSADTTRGRKGLGIQPTTSVQEGLTEQFTWALESAHRGLPASV